MRFLHFSTSAIFICFICVSVLADAPQRPSVPLGGTNWTARSGPGTLPTQDMNSGLTAADLVAALLGPGVNVSNVSLNCANVAAGTFSGGTGIIGFESGVILSSGNIISVAGPDNFSDQTTTVNGAGGDADLAALIPGFTTLDACVLEFDFECNDVQVIQFQYTFASEEYNEYAFTAYNDVFGFFLNGSNIAIVPGSGGSPVSIDNINCGNPYAPPSGGNNCSLFINNDCSDIGGFPCSAVDTEMDGLTVVFTATGALLPGVNHIKLAIADAGDDVLDSNVFIKGESFQCAVPTGACCNRAALNCTESVLEANCMGAGMEWYVGLTCNQIDPTCAQPAIVPAVSEWGLIVLVLIGLVAGTLTFGRKPDTNPTI